MTFLLCTVIKEKILPVYNGKKIRYVYQPKLLGTWDALLRCKKFLGHERFLVCYADDLYHAKDIEAMLQHDRSILVMRHKNPERYGVAKTNAHGYITHIIEKPQTYVGNLISVGVYVLGPEFFRIKKWKEKNKEYFLPVGISKIAKKVKIKAVKTNFWFPIGYPEDLEKAKRVIKQRRLA